MALSPAINAVVLLAVMLPVDVKPVNVPTDVRLLDTTVELSVVPVNDPAAADVKAFHGVRTQMVLLVSINV
jgi:hypothetical protein